MQCGEGRFCDEEVDAVTDKKMIVVQCMDVRDECASKAVKETAFPERSANKGGSRASVCGFWRPQLVALAV